MKRSTPYFSLALLCILATGCASLSERSGRADARRDLANGVLAKERFGLPVVCINEYSELLRERYRIELRSVAGCVVDSRILGHARGYNGVMVAEIERRFGTNIWGATMSDALKQYEDKHGKIQRDR
jgi:hypothetical protein